MKKIEIYDTTLRDGTQGEGVSFTSEDKLKIAQSLDAIGIDYIEGGWPGSNPRDMDFFKKAVHLKLKHARLAAFGSTRRANVTPEKDPNLNALLESKTPVCTIFGKSWDFHVHKALKVSLEENLKMIYESCTFLKSKRRYVIYDAEHYFDGFKNNPEYALLTIEQAVKARAKIIVLCDTNGGTMPYELVSIVETVMDQYPKVQFGIHAHNDSGVGIANSVMAVEQGCMHVQGTINGYGERCGNADLTGIIPNLQLKMNYSCVPKSQIKHLTELSRYVSEVANLVHRKRAPFVGESAFAHKGGIHVSAVMKDAHTYEHVPPESVGNRRRVLLSDLSGRSNVVYKSHEMDLETLPNTATTASIVQEIKKREHEGYQYEDAEASFELLVRRHEGKMPEFFKLGGFRVITARQPSMGQSAEAIIKVEVNGIIEHTAADGDGPVNALDNAIRKALKPFYPTLKDMHLTDYRVRVIDGREATMAQVRVIIESTSRFGTWNTVGVSTNVIEASWEALVDATNYYLLKTVYGKKKKTGKKKAKKRVKK